MDKEELRMALLANFVFDKVGKMKLRRERRVAVSADEALPSAVARRSKVAEQRKKLLGNYVKDKLHGLRRRPRATRRRVRRCSPRLAQKKRRELMHRLMVERPTKSQRPHNKRRSLPLKYRRVLTQRVRMEMPNSRRCSDHDIDFMLFSALDHHLKAYDVDDSLTLMLSK